MRAARVYMFFMVPVVLSSGTASGAKDPKLRPEDVVRRHLESIGPSGIRSETRSIKAEGTAGMEVVTGGSGRLQGPATLLYDGRKMRLSMVFGINDYPGEEVVYDGRIVNAGYIAPGVRSKLGHFLYDFGEILSEGLFGGTLSTAWPLLDLDARKPKLQYEGLKKVDGAEYHALKYRRRGGGDVQTMLYFDRETFRHSHTIYKVRITAPIISSDPNQSANQPETWYTLKESFFTFLEMEKLTLPSRWTIEFTTEIGREGSVVRWITQYATIGRNVEIDPGLFALY